MRTKRSGIITVVESAVLKSLCCLLHLPISADNGLVLYEGVKVCRRLRNLPVDLTDQGENATLRRITGLSAALIRTQRDDLATTKQDDKKVWSLLNRFKIINSILIARARSIIARRVENDKSVACVCVPAYIL